MSTHIIKVCGITNSDDARDAVDAGANALGFNFYGKSPRRVTPEAAKAIIHKTVGNYLKVGIFVNSEMQEIAEISELLRLDVVQIHGRFDASNHPHIWRAIAASQELPATDPTIEAYLIDTPTEAHGGSGRTFDWSIAEAFPYRKIVAGGLDGENVGAAIQAAKPWGVDACSRLETRPGKKDTSKVKAYVLAARTAFEGIS